MVVTISRQGALEALIQAMFNDEELRGFFRRLPDAEPLLSGLPGGSASLLKVAFEAIGLFERHGIIDDDFFAALVEIRPRQRSKIEGVAAMWGVTLPPPAAASPSMSPTLPTPRQPATSAPTPTATATSSPPPATSSISPETESWDAFISYAHADADWVRILAENLHRLGLDVFFDEWEIDAGTVVSLRLGEGLRRSRNGILVVSKASVSRPWVLEEFSSLLQSAVERGQRLIPVLIEEADLPAMLATRRWIDFRGLRHQRYGAAVRELASALRGERPKKPPRGGALRSP